MGEFALCNGQRIKIGTCEDMYYLRADQAHRVRPLAGNVNPLSEEDRKVIRFRFPFPGEDDVAPGEFADAFHGIVLYAKVPGGVHHHSVQFSAKPGYLVSMECPESGDGAERDDGLKIHRNGFPGYSRIVQQAYRGGNLALVCECSGCGAKYALWTLEDAKPYVDAIREKAESRRRDYRRNDTKGDLEIAKEWDAIADRIAAGYAHTPCASDHDSSKVAP